MAREQSLHFLRFSLEYCRRAGLLDETGRPLTIFGIAQALYNFEVSHLRNRVENDDAHDHLVVYLFLCS
jgi:hypothetical protein